MGWGGGICSSNRGKRDEIYRGLIEDGDTTGDTTGGGGRWDPGAWTQSRGVTLIGPASDLTLAFFSHTIIFKLSERGISCQHERSKSAGLRWGSVDHWGELFAWANAPDRRASPRCLASYYCSACVSPSAERALQEMMGLLLDY